MTRRLVAMGLLASFFVTACASDSDSGGAESAGKVCAQWGDGCVCRDEPSDGDVDFEGTCDQQSMGERGLCCRGDDYCRCEPVVCGISSTSGNCACGVGLYLDSLVASCDGTAGTCCTQGTGYCYCEDGCENRFANTVVSSCDRNTSAATCAEGQTQVASCQ